MQSLKVGVTRVVNVRDVVPSLPGFTSTALKQVSPDADRRASMGQSVFLQLPTMHVIA